MARATKNRRGRPIAVGGHHLRWRIEWLPDDRIVRIVAYSALGGSPRLLADQRYDEMTRLPFLPHKESQFTPQHVEGFIRKALIAGWNPGSRGADFRLSGFASIILDVIGMSAYKKGLTGSL